ncbi:acetyltransferase [Labrenzia sp. CP4]|jgi:GNAT superfamily N-acetyltransferase|uniref:GNAT family N-acetyltransferase n=1 Tax=Labrenzia sp. CP4 TaxID=1674922 RepID=UPI00078586C4|nr:GNAT family N-acetyltransferase [Labrenzia sp. CP4]AMN54307.1 acetyltransferase [Labrenzia sp. CP4]
MTLPVTETGRLQVRPFTPEAPVDLMSADEVRRSLPALGQLLKACVEDGAGIGFLLPMPQDKAEAFWASKLPAIESGEAFLLATRQGADIAGVVMLVKAGADNQPHRADVAKLMVHPEHRRKGLARKLMSAIDGLARSENRWMLVLDTVTGDRAEKLYPTCGYQKVGVIPDYAYNSHGHLDATTVFFKDLR